MRKIVFISIILLFLSCSKSSDFYSGYIYDKTSNKPLSQVYIKENFKTNYKSTSSDKNGFFKINNDTESLGDLIFILKNYKTDTVVTVWSQNGEKIKYRFVGENHDTLYMSRIYSR
ncbi:peptidase associated/transthyretin-like domain-containing protein [Chryseobacterium polytrichastri]|uniref:CarboxypepD_reg-like domain-containing protein n=1 Tax=Chryseobacterium polytrichastri TaxID=1302687 RepID=A0A1M6QVP0_9FLAO|nr:hypothetical protein [Chryseobacterium polytrichastri]SHK24183.1 hypothetical protein SAMN05444267_1002105 [Chryseobacterium polytrichastri]